MTRIRKLTLIHLASALCLAMTFTSTKAAQIQPLGNYTLVNTITNLSVLPSWGTAPTNFSDVTYNYDTGTLFIIDNGDRHVYEYSTAGRRSAASLGPVSSTLRGSHTWGATSSPLSKRV